MNSPQPLAFPLKSSLRFAWKSTVTGYCEVNGLPLRIFWATLSPQTGADPLVLHAKRPTIVLFDLDGTLVHHVNPRVLQMLEFLDDCSHRGGRLVARFRLRRRNLAAAPGKTPKLLVHKAIHKVRRKSVEQMLLPCDVMRETLKRLKSEGVTLGVVSNGLGRGYGHDVLDAFGLREYFSKCVFREDVARGKPWPDSIVAALGGIGRELRRSDVVWYIGDQRKDIAAALEASKMIGHQIRPIALGARAALGAVEARLSPSHIMWTPYDFLRAVESVFDDAEPGMSFIDPLPAPLL